MTENAEFPPCWASDRCHLHGTRPFEDWFSGIDETAAAKLSVAIARLDQGDTSDAKGPGVKT
jgi:hypothetical protein